MKLVGLESLADLKNILKQQKKEEAKRKNIVVSSTHKADDNDSIEAEARKRAREEHRAEVKAAKKAINRFDAMRKSDQEFEEMAQDALRKAEEKRKQEQEALRFKKIQQEQEEAERKRKAEEEEKRIVQQRKERAEREKVAIQMRKEQEAKLYKDTRERKRREIIEGTATLEQIKHYAQVYPEDTEVQKILKEKQYQYVFGWLDRKAEIQKQKEEERIRKIQEEEERGIAEIERQMIERQKLEERKKHEEEERRRIEEEKARKQWEEEHANIDAMKATLQKRLAMCNSLETKIQSATDEISIKKVQLESKHKAIEIESERVFKDNPELGGPVGKISTDIESHFQKEKSQNVTVPALARADMDGQTYWIVNFIPTEFSGKYDRWKRPLKVFVCRGLIAKNSRTGVFITEYDPMGQHSDRIQNRAQWERFGFGIRNLDIQVTGKREHYRYARLLDVTEQLNRDTAFLQNLNNDVDNIESQIRYNESLIRINQATLVKVKAACKEIEKEIKQALHHSEEAKKQEELEKQKELEKKKIEEARRLKETRKKLAEARQEANRELAEMQAKIDNEKQRVAKVKSYIRSEHELRQQHFLDIVQNKIKRSHFYDNVPLIIEGGPGTGKTTTMVQRLKFLVDPAALKDFENPLSEEQKNRLLDEEHLHTNWLFISPTRQLLLFLRNNMIREGLYADNDNTKTIGKLREDMFHAYRLKSPNSDGPFKMIENKEGEEPVLIFLNPLAAIEGFGNYVLQSTFNTIEKVTNLKTSNFQWNTQGIIIKGMLSKLLTLTDLCSLIKELESIKKTIQPEISNIEQLLKEQADTLSMEILQRVKEDCEDYKNIEDLFDRWYEEAIEEDEEDNDDEVAEADDTEEDSTLRPDTRTLLFNNLTKIVKKLALQKYENSPLGKRLKEVYGIVGHYITDVIQAEENEKTEIAEILGEKDKTRIEIIGEYSWFMKHMAGLCKGAGNAILSQIPKLYKQYRKSNLGLDNSPYDKTLLTSVVQKGNKYLYADEIDIIIGFINNLLILLSNKSNVTYKDLKHKYVNAYNENSKYVIGVDEVTDYTAMDLYFISSLRNNQFSSITMCGDILQGLTNSGISKWSDIDSVMPQKAEVIGLVTSYRQTPTLVEMAQNMYFDEMGKKAPYESKMEKSDVEAKPLALVTSDDTHEAEWIAKRINEIYRIHDQQMPSVAVFVGRNVNVAEYIERLKANENLLNGIRIEDCTDNRKTEGDNMVRIFNLEDVKGMEFEVAIFHNLDEALSGHDSALMRRYLYVGISRATSHLCATFRNEKGNEGILKYFDRNCKSWL